MNTAFRILATALLALWVAIPGISGDGEGGENAGGTGVWILPRCEMLSSGSSQNGGLEQPRVAAFAVPNLNSDVHLRVSNECGQTAATLFDHVSESPLALPVVGQFVTLPASVLQGLLAARVARSDIVIFDAAQKGYRLELRIDLETAAAQILVF